MRRDAAFLDDILEAAESIRSICAGQDIEAVAGSKILRAAILHHLTVIGEAAKRLSPELRASHDSLPWPHIISQRNRIVHDYFGLDWDLIWTSATVDVPALADWASRVLAEEFPPPAEENECS